MVAYGHRVCDDLHTIMEAAIMLDVDMGVVCISNLQDQICITVRFSSVVDLQLYTQETRPSTIEDRSRFVAVALNP